MAHEEYVRRVQRETERYSQDLLSENERLRAEIAALDEARSTATEEAARLKDEVALLHDALARRETTRLALEEKLRAAAEEGRRFSQEYVDVQQQNTNLANLYVASYRLHGTLRREELLQTIQEILANLVGCEEMALFEADSARGGLVLVTFFGIGPDSFRWIPFGRGVIGRVASTGAVHITQRDGLDGATDEETALTACVPLKLGSRIAGAIALFRLLPQKQGFEALDQEIFELLAEQAAVALYCTALHARATDASTR